jgi:hypothetical protein
MIRATTALVHCSLHEDLTFVEYGFLVLSWWYLVNLLQGVDHYMLEVVRVDHFE